MAKWSALWVKEVRSLGVNSAECGRALDCNGLPFQVQINDPFYCPRNQQRFEQSVIILTARDDFAWLGQCGSSEGTGKCRERGDRAAASPDRSGGRMRGFTRRAVNSLQSHPRRNLRLKPALLA